MTPKNGEVDRGDPLGIDPLPTDLLRWDRTGALANVLAHSAKTPCKSAVSSRSRKPLGVQAPQGFESLPLRFYFCGFDGSPSSEAETNGLGGRSAQSTEVHWDP
jgi:hypothetical protein